MLPLFPAFFLGTRFTSTPRTSSWRTYLGVNLPESSPPGLLFSQTRSTTLASGHTFAGALYLTLGGTTNSRFVEASQPHQVCHLLLLNRFVSLTVRHSPDPTPTPSSKTATAVYSTFEETNLQTTDGLSGKKCGRFTGFRRGYLSGCRRGRP